MNGYIKNKYNIKFNTIIADCKEYLVNIFKDNERLLKQINLLILEHNFNTENDIHIFYYLMKKDQFEMIDKFLKTDNGCLGINWEDGIKSANICVSVWKN